jgi:pimeloyl-ACP methyl ester carboxylesterase
VHLPGTTLAPNSLLRNLGSRSALSAVALAIATACTPPSVSNAPPSTVQLTDCAREMGVSAAQCGKVEVFEDRDRGQGRTIDLNVVVLPAVKSSAKDPLFFLAGGPGMGATELIKVIRSTFRRLNRERDIVLVDQRGTGSSNPLNCDYEYLDFEARFEIQPDLKLLRVCADSLSRHADLRLYTTSIAMDDLEEVRAALGYEEINLYGGSYGTRAALEYMRRHGDRVRSVVLDGVAPTDMSIPNHFGVDSQRALDMMFADCRQDSSCNAAFPQLEVRFYELLDRLEKSPEQVRLSDPFTGKEHTLVMQREIVATLSRAVLYNSALTSLLPLLLDRAYEGDYQPLMTMSSAFEGIERKFSAGMFLSVVCTEDMPHIDAPIPRESFLKGAIVERFRAVCGEWPRGELTPGYHDPIVSDIPTLVLSGDVDPVTPPRWGERVADHLSRGRHIVVPGISHGVLRNGCVPDLMIEFVNAASADSLDATCVNELHRMPFFNSPTGPLVNEAL